MNKETAAVKAKLEAEGMRNVILNALPQNITNGDLIKTLFPNLEWVEACEDVDFYLLDGDTPYVAKLNTCRSWWNAPYKAESEE